MLAEMLFVHSLPCHHAVTPEESIVDMVFMSFSHVVMHLHVQNERKGHMITDLHSHVDLPVSQESCLPGGACRVDHLAVDYSIIRTKGFCT